MTIKVICQFASHLVEREKPCARVEREDRAQGWSGKTVRKTLENSVRMFLTWVGWEHTYDGED